MYTKTDAKPKKSIWENDQSAEFLLIWGPKWPPNWGSEVHILSSNKHINLDWCESRGNF